MRKETLVDAVGLINEELINEASEKTKKKKVNYIKWVSAVAAALVVIMVSVILIDPFKPQVIVPQGLSIIKAEYPEMEKYPEYDDMGNWESYEKAYDAWFEDKEKQKNQYEGYEKGLEEFFKLTVKEFLAGESSENKAYSPLNLYFALCMLSETTEGESRQEVLNLLGSEDIGALRKQAKAIWNANYSSDGLSESLLGSSIWIDNIVPVNEDVLLSLKNNYFASAYFGDLYSEEINKELKNWLNENTGGLLKDVVEKTEFDAETLLAIISTLYFRDKWENGFGVNSTETDTFYSPEGETRAEFMKGWEYGKYFIGESFGAVKKNFMGGGGMWFILPDEGVSANELILSDSALKFIATNGEGFENKELLINLSLPKFDVTSKLVLAEGLKNLGVKEVFGKNADFSALCGENSGLSVSEVKQNARVKIDEEGVEAAAFTIITADGGAILPDDEIDFVLNRPFIYVITGADGLPLFVGIINNPAN